MSNPNSKKKKNNNTKSLVAMASEKKHVESSTTERGEELSLKEKVLSDFVRDFANSLLLIYKTEKSTTSKRKRTVTTESSRLISIFSHWCKLPISSGYSVNSPSRSESIKIVAKELLTSFVDVSIVIQEINDSIIHNIYLFSNKPAFVVPSTILTNIEMVMLLKFVELSSEIFDSIEYDKPRKILTMSKMKPFLRFKLEPKMVLYSLSYSILTEGFVTKKYSSSKDVILSMLRDIKDSNTISDDKEDVLSEIIDKISAPIIDELAEYIKFSTLLHRYVQSKKFLNGKEL
jgi:hypothetical protein